MASLVLAGAGLVGVAAVASSAGAAPVQATQERAQTASASYPQYHKTWAACRATGNQLIRTGGGYYTGFTCTRVWWGAYKLKMYTYGNAG